MEPGSALIASTMGKMLTGLSKLSNQAVRITWGST